MDTDTLGSSELDYFTYFFLLSKATSGLVISVPDIPGPARPEPMASQKRGFQLFKPVPIAGEPDHVWLENEYERLVLATDGQGNLTATQKSDEASQRWMFTADGQMRNAASATAVLTLSEDGQSLAMRAPVANEPRQVFERFFPSDFSYIRNTWFGHFLTAHDNGSVSWEQLNTASEPERQQWGTTRDGFLVNRAFAKVLQSAASGTTEGQALTIGVPNASGSSSLYQRFDVVAEDGCFHNRRDTGFVIACDGGRAVLQHGDGGAKQFAEFISPFQFFRLFTNACYGGDAWLARGQTDVWLNRNADTRPNELFTVSRYGELISMIDGLVVRSRGAMKTLGMVDTALPEIGFADTTFQYSPIAAYPDFGTIMLRDASLRLTCVGRTPVQVVMDRPGTTFPWRITPPGQSMMSVYPYVAREFFSQPAPLPGMAMWLPDVDLATLDPETAALVANLDRTTRVAVTAVLGIIEIFTGFGPNAGTAWRVADRIAGYLFANKSIVDTIALLMMAGAPVGLLINLADEILKADLWLKIFALLIPSSYWGWAIAVAKISLSVAQWIPGAGWPVFGARLVILMAEIAKIIAEDEAAVAIELTLLAEHSATLEARGALPAPG